MRRTLLPRLALAASCLALAPAAPAVAENGNLPDRQLAPIVAPAGCTQLAKAPAAAYNTMALYAGRDLPVNGCASAYRRCGRPGDGWRATQGTRRGAYGTQWYFWETLPRGQAARPCTSNHGLGLAIDVPQWVRETVDRVGRRFGWCKCWSDAAHEWWHLKWRAGAWKRRPDPGTDPANPLLRKGSGGPGQAKHVRILQRRLRAHGRDRVRVDGKFGRRTCAATRRFKRARKLPHNCETGPATWRALRARPGKRGGSA